MASESALVKRLQKVKGVRFIKISDRWQTGFPDLLWMHRYRHDRVIGLAEAKEPGFTSDERPKLLGLEKEQGPYMDGLVRDHARVALILDLGKGTIGVLREHSDEPMRFTNLGKYSYSRRVLETRHGMLVMPTDQVVRALYP